MKRGNRDMNHLIRDEQGSMLVFTIMVLCLLTIIALLASNNSVVEVQTATNDTLQKIAFYQADGGTGIGSLMLEENIACANRFKDSSHQAGGTLDGSELDIGIDNEAFWMNELDENTYDPSTFDPQSQRDLHYPPDDSGSHINIAMLGVSGLSPGSALQILAGYEGKGKGAAGGGGFTLHDIHSQFKGSRKNESIIKIQWLHLVGQEGTCRY